MRRHVPPVLLAMFSSLGCWENSNAPVIEPGRLAFRSTRGGTVEGLALAASDGDRVMMYLGGPVDRPVWSPDGRLLAFQRQGPGERADIYFVRLIDNEVRSVTRTAGSDERDPAWSPDGGLIAYGATYTTPDGPADSIVIATPDGVSRSSIATGSDPAWAADGRIAFVDRADAGTQTVIWVLGEDWARRPAAPASSDGRSDSEPAWSPSGRLAWTRDGTVREPDGTTRRRWSIMVQPSPEAVPVAIVTDTVPLGAPAWSPDGTELVITASWTGTPQLWVMGADGTRRRRVTSSPCGPPCGNLNAAWAR